MNGHMTKKHLYLLIGGAIFVSTAGTLLHFLYEWTGQSRLAALIAPVNESTWEHMKLIFFPMLFYSLIAAAPLRTACPHALSALFSGMIWGTCLIPAAFYTYTGILGYHIAFIDIALFYVSVLVAFIIAYRALCRRRFRKASEYIWPVIVLIFLAAFVRFTFNPPSIGLFK